VTTSVLVNIAGFLLGAALYGLLLAMAARSQPTWRAGDARTPRWFERPMVWAGVLGLLWNLGAFVVYGFPAAGTASLVPGLLVVSFAALGFLPAVVVHVVLGAAEASSRPLRQAVGLGAYALSTMAAGFHVVAFVAGQPLPSRTALSLLTVGFLALLWPLVRLTRRARSSRAVWVVALALFGVSALHLVTHTGGDAWWVEVLGHQGSLLLPLAILLRDYRFAFADIFLKRALALSLTVGLVLATHVILRRWDPGLGATEDSLAAYLLGLAVLTALAQPRFQLAAKWLVDKVVLRRADYDDVLRTLEHEVSSAPDEDALLARAEARIGRALGATAMATTPAAGEAGSSRPVLVVDGPSAAITIPTVEAPHLAWRVGRLAGERRLLSDDVRLLESAASMVGRRVDAMRVGRERVQAAVREQRMAGLATEAELRALRAQVDPHFLFNALSTIRYLIRSSPAGAEATLLRLTSLLRAVLRRTRVEFTTLGDEIDLVEAYLEIERARFEERLRVTIDVPAALRSARLPSLLIQPLVENAVKHGIAPNAAGGAIAIAAAEVPLDGGRMVRIAVHDSGTASSAAAWARGREQGLGLANVEQRLQGHYGSRASFAIETGGGTGTTVTLTLPLDAVGEPAPRQEVLV